MQVEATVVVGPLGRDALPEVVERVGTEVVNVSGTVLRKSLDTLLTELNEVFSELPETVGPFQVDEVELGVTIGATGDLKIVSGRAESSIKITLRRPAT